MRHTCAAQPATVTCGLPCPCEQSILAATLSRFTADAYTVPGLLERLHNRCASKQRTCPGDVAVEQRHHWMLLYAPAMVVLWWAERTLDLHPRTNVMSPPALIYPIP